MNVAKNIFILEEIKYSIREIVTNVIIDNLFSYCVDLSEIKVEADKTDPTIIHITLPKIVTNKTQK